MSRAVERVRQAIRQAAAPLPNGTQTPQRVRMRMVPAYQPLPVDALPTPIREYVSALADAIGCDVAYPALPALAVAGSCIGSTRAVQLKRGWTEPPVIWSAIVGESGTGKSPAYRAVVAHLWRVQRRLIEQHRRELAERHKSESDDPGPAPVLQRVVVSDITIERLAEVLEDSPRGTLVARDELAGWLGSYRRYRGRDGGSDLAGWLELWQCGTLTYDRRTGERRSIVVPHASVSITGSIQPGTLARALTPDLMDAGLAARLLLAWPTRRAKCWRDVEVDQASEETYCRMLDGLLRLCHVEHDGERLPSLIYQSAEARQLWVIWYDRWAQEQAEAEGELAAALAKLEAYAARLALVHHCVTHVHLDSSDRRPLGVVSMDAGIRLAEWFAWQARRIYATLSESASERQTRRLMEWIQSRGGRVTVRDLHRAHQSRYRSAEDAESAMSSLVQAGLAYWIDGEPSSRGGHRVRTLALHMTDDTCDTRPEREPGQEG